MEAYQLAFRGNSPWDVILGRAPPPLGIFADSDFLKV